MLSTFPSEISHDEVELKIIWKDSFVSNYSLIDLRKKCPCATCRGGHGGKVGQATGYIQSIKLLSWKKVGRYALNFYWSDNHDTGIYTFDNLRAYSENSSHEL